jgi:hypothetical protein
MKELLDLDRYPIDRLDSPEAAALVARCQADLAADGLFNLDGLVHQQVIERCAAKLQPKLDTESFTHQRSHNVYFLKSVPGLDPDHPALRHTQTLNHTLCADQLRDSDIGRIYAWQPLADFLAAVMEKPALYLMEDPLASVNVMGYRAGETLNWHFDRSVFTTTLLIQAAEVGGEFEYCSNLRSETDRNYEGVVRVLDGDRSLIRKLAVKPGTLNVFKGKNALHRVSPPAGKRDRIIAVFSYYERPGVVFSPEERLGFYGRAG